MSKFTASPALFGRFAARAVLALSLTLTAGVHAADPWDSGDQAKPKTTTPAKPKAKPETGDAKPSLKEEGKALFAPEAATPNSWTIAIVAFRGDGADEAGKMALHKVQTEGGLPKAFSERRGDAVVICVGAFESPSAPQATQELKRVQSIEIGGKRPYADAILSPPLSVTNMGSTPQFNLVQAKALLGDEALYTLQVAVYGRRDLLQPTEADLAEGRKAAELAALRLRQEGEQAFYYHGPRMSMVTVGVFGIDDFDPQTPSYKSTRLIDTQKRHPYNLYNGAGIKEKIAGARDARMQSSTLVAIPTK